MGNNEKKRRYVSCPRNDPLSRDRGVERHRSLEIPRMQACSGSRFHEIMYRYTTPLLFRRRFTRSAHQPKCREPAAIHNGRVGDSIIGVCPRTSIPSGKSRGARSKRPTPGKMASREIARHSREKSRRGCTLVDDAAAEAENSRFRSRRAAQRNAVLRSAVRCGAVAAWRWCRHRLFSVIKQRQLRRPTAGATASTAHMHGRAGGREGGAECSPSAVDRR